MRRATISLALLSLLLCSCIQSPEEKSAAFVKSAKTYLEKKDYATGDSIRQRLGELGVILEDKKGVTEWRIANS